MRSRVGIFVPRVLERSMTFVDRQLRSYTSFDPVLIGIRPVQSYCPVDISVATVSRNSARLTVAEMLFRRYGYAPKFYKELKTMRLSLVHGHFGWSLQSLVHLKKRFGLPTVLTFHGRDATLSSEVLRASWAGREYIRILPMASRAVDRVIAVSNFIRERLIASGWDSSKIITLHNGIDVDDFRPGDCSREPVILGIGRFVEKKGFKYLLEAAAMLGKKGISHKLVLVGDGPLGKELRRDAIRLNINVQFTGFLQPLEVRHWLNCATALCVPSVTAADGDSEGLPTVILEANAMETPVVATRHAGNPEAIIHKCTGFLAPERSPADLALYLEMLLKDTRLQRSMGRQARRHMENNFRSEMTSRRIEMLYEELLSR